MTVEVVMSWRPGCPHREAALKWVMRRWIDVGWGVMINGADDGHGWNRAHDITPMVEASNAEVIVVADADCWTHGIHDAVAAVENGAAWAVPHLMMCRLSEDATVRVLAGEPAEEQTDYTERPYKGHAAGTMFVIRRDVYLDCPLDPRFVGWGQEDDALNLALTLLHDKPWRGQEPMYHLWHPPQSRKNRAIGNDANLALYRRYKLARHDPDRMRAIIEQAKAVAA